MSPKGLLGAISGNPVAIGGLVTTALGLLGMGAQKMQKTKMIDEGRKLRDADPADAKKIYDASKNYT